MTKRVAKIAEFKTYVENELITGYKAIENDSNQQYADMEAQRLLRGEDGEFDETRDLDNRGIV